MNRLGLRDYTLKLGATRGQGEAEQHQDFTMHVLASSEQRAQEWGMRWLRTFLPEANGWQEYTIGIAEGHFPVGTAL